MKSKKALFQIEIIVAVLLIILLWLSSCHKIAHLKDEAKRSLSAKNHTMLTDAITVYRGDNEGKCPAVLEDLLREHIDKIPLSYGREGVVSAQVKNGAYRDTFDGKGGWIYINDMYDGDYCKVLPNTN
jgi:hypothetical protein